MHHELSALLTSDNWRGLESRLEKGLDPNLMSGSLQTLLGAAVRKGAVQCLRKLVDFGAEINAGDPTPVEISIYARRADLLEELIRLGATIKGAEPYNPDYPAPIVVAVETGEHRLVEKLLSHGSFVNERWAVIDDAFRAALELKGRSRRKILKSLVEHVVRDHVEISPTSGRALRALKFLKTLRANSDASEFNGVLGQFSEQLSRIAAELGEAEDAFLEDRFDDLARLICEVPEGRRGQILGIVAVYATGGCYQLSKWLAENGAAVNLCDDDGRTALMHVAAHGSSLLVNSLINTGSAALNAEDRHGRTAQDHLRKRGTFRSAQRIESLLNSSYSLSLDRGELPIKITECSEVVRAAAKLMRDHQFTDLLEHLDSIGEDKEEWALAAGAAILEDCANSSMCLLEYCLDEKADLNVRNDRGTTVLHGACGVHHIPLRVLRRIVDGGADVKALDERGKTVVDVARRTWDDGHECLEYIESLVS